MFLVVAVIYIYLSFVIVPRRGRACVYAFFCLSAAFKSRAHPRFCCPNPTGVFGSGASPLATIIGVGSLGSASRGHCNEPTHILGLALGLALGLGLGLGWI